MTSKTTYIGTPEGRELSDISRSKDLNHLDYLKHSPATPGGGSLGRLHSKPGPCTSEEDSYAEGDAKKHESSGYYEGGGYAGVLEDKAR